MRWYIKGDTTSRVSNFNCFFDCIGVIYSVIFWDGNITVFFSAGQGPLKGGEQHSGRACIATACRCGSSKPSTRRRTYRILSDIISSSTMKSERISVFGTQTPTYLVEPSTTPCATRYFIVGRAEIGSLKVDPSEHEKNYSADQLVRTRSHLGVEPWYASDHLSSNHDMPVRWFRRGHALARFFASRAGKC